MEVENLTLLVILIHFAHSVTHDRPHIVFLVADDLGWNDVGYHGSEILTPTIDQLAKSGVQLENYYVQPACSPSRGALMSGRYPIHIGLQHEVIYAGQRACLPSTVKTLAEELRYHGYATHGIGKWHLGFYEQSCLPTSRGFDSWLGYMTGNEDYYTKMNCEKLGCGYDFYNNSNIDLTDNNTYSTIRFTHRAKEIIANHDSKTPMFLYIPYQAVHSPLQVPDVYLEPYMFINDERRRIFAGMTSCLDESISNITQYLKEAGMWNDTILIFTTDNGGESMNGGSNWPLRGKKWTLWEGGLHGVAFVHSTIPGLLPNNFAVHKYLMHISDWYPTIIQGILGKNMSEPELTFDGVNMWHSITGNTPGPRTELLHNIDPLIPPAGNPLYNDTFPTSLTAAIRVGDWKLITGNPGIDRWFPVPTDTENETRHKNWLDHYIQVHGSFMKEVMNYDLAYHDQLFDIDMSNWDDAKYKKLADLNPANQNVWLFNITADPEEIIDLSYYYPSVVEELLQRLLHFNTTAVTPNFPSLDPLATPTNHNGTWTPWVGMAKGSATATADIFDVPITPIAGRAGPSFRDLLCDVLHKSYSMMRRVYNEWSSFY